MTDLHTHGDAPAHEHDDAPPGHTHTGAVTTQERPPETERPRAEAYPATQERPGTGGFVIRALLTVVGAAGMIGGPFLDWTVGTRGINTEMRALVGTSEGAQAGFAASAGLVLIVLGAIALVGLLPRGGWLTGLAGAFGLAATILVATSAVRADATLGDFGPGLWIAAAGSLIALIASFTGSRPRVVSA